MSYNRGKIEELLRSALTETQMRELCTNCFPEISDDFNTLGLRLSERVEVLMGYVMKGESRIVRLLEAIKERNQERYGAFEPHLRATKNLDDGANHPVIVPTQLPYLCDRSFQEGDLKNALREHTSDPEKRKNTLMCIIHGRESECHDAFIQRITNVDIFRRLYKSETLIEMVSSRELVYPKPRGNRRSYLGDLSRHLSQELDDYLESLPRDSHPVVFYSYMDTGDWRFGGAEFVKAFLAFWNTRPSVTDRLQVACLCVKYRAGGAINWWHRKQCRNFLLSLQDEKFPGFENLLTVLLTELHSVEKSEAEEWARSEYVQPWWKESRQDLETKVHEIYERYRSQRPWGRAREAIPMAVLAPKLKDLLLEKID